MNISTCLFAHPLLFVCVDVYEWHVLYEHILLCYLFGVTFVQFASLCFCLMRPNHHPTTISLFDTNIIVVIVLRYCFAASHLQHHVVLSNISVLWHMLQKPWIVLLCFLCHMNWMHLLMMFAEWLKPHNSFICCPLYRWLITMGPTWHNGRPMTTTEYKVVKKVWLGNTSTLYNFKEVALLKRCWFARGHGQIMIWRRDDFVDPHTGILLFGQEVNLESDSD